MIRLKNETEKLLLSITKNCESLIKQTHRKAGKTLEFRLTKPRENISFKTPISIDKYWMIGLTTLEVYKSIFNISEENNKFDLYKNTFIEFSFGDLKDEIREILKISDITPSHLQHEIIGPRFIETYNKFRLDISCTNGCIILIMSYARFPVRDFKSYLRMVVGLDEDDIQIILKQYNSSFATYESSPGIYTNKVISEIV